jgi:hypothetical protein
MVMLGYGIQPPNTTYKSSTTDLIPLDAQLDDENEVSYKAINAGLVLAKMDQAKSDVNIVVLDACRDNPFGRSFRSSSRGLASMDKPIGTIIAYATKPGKTAADGNGANGVYTQELLRPEPIELAPVARPTESEPAKPQISHGLSAEVLRKAESEEGFRQGNHSNYKETAGYHLPDFEEQMGV